jgi:hypothetical protein
MSGTMSVTTTAGVIQGVFNGTSHVLAAGTQADWNYLQNSAYTLGVVVSAGQFSPSTYSTTGNGMYVQSGPGGTSVELNILASSSSIHRCMATTISQVKSVCVFRISPSTKAALSSSPLEYSVAFQNGQRVGYRTSTWTTSGLDPTNTLRIGKTTTQAAFLAGTYLDFFIDNREWPDEEVYAYTAYWHYKLGLV